MVEERLNRLETQVARLNIECNSIQTTLAAIDKKLGRKNAFDYVVGAILTASACIVGIVILL